MKKRFGSVPYPHHYRRHLICCECRGCLRPYAFPCVQKELSDVREPSSGCDQLIAFHYGRVHFYTSEISSRCPKWEEWRGISACWLYDLWSPASCVSWELDRLILSCRIHTLKTHDWGIVQPIIIHWILDFSVSDLLACCTRVKLAAGSFTCIHHSTRLFRAHVDTTRSKRTE